MHKSLPVLCVCEKDDCEVAVCCKDSACTPCKAQTCTHLLQLGTRMLSWLF